MTNSGKIATIASLYGKGLAPQATLILMRAVQERNRRLVEPDGTIRDAFVFVEQSRAMRRNNRPGHLVALQSHLEEKK
jgi:hypothetical protein